MQQLQIPASFISIIILIAAFMIILLAAFLIIFFVLSRNKQNKLFEEKIALQSQFKEELLQLQLETQENSFNQISQELHDNIGQLLSSTKLLLNIGASELEYVPDAFKTAEQTVGKAIQDLRDLSKTLNNEWLNRFNLIENLETEKARINAARKIKVEVSNQYEIMPLQPEAQLMLFRIVQEALQNSIKHAAPENINIIIKNSDGLFELIIQDDGRGFDYTTAKIESIGLRNMEHRTHLLGGKISWQTANHQGTCITIKIPLEESR
jgi:signal transduction histidine kinase